MLTGRGLPCCSDTELEYLIALGLDGALRYPRLCEDVEIPSFSEGP